MRASPLAGEQPELALLDLSKFRFVAQIGPLSGTKSRNETTGV
jgi:hypothetical protein